MTLMLALCLLQDPREVELKREIEQAQARLKAAGTEEERAEVRERIERLKAQVEDLRARRDEDRELYAYMRNSEAELLEQVEYFQSVERHDLVEHWLGGARERLRLGKENPEEHGRIFRLLMGESLSEALGERLRTAKDEKERTALKERLKRLLPELFDAKEVLRKRELEEIARRAEELKGLLERRKEKRESIIERRFKQLIGEAADDEW